MESTEGCSLLPPCDGKGTDHDTEESRSSTCFRCSSGFWSRVKKYHLSDFSSLPEYLRDNEFILTGYRVHFPLRQAFLSIFRLHNETGNIWTHLLGFLVFLGLTIYTFITWQKTGHVPTMTNFTNLTSFSNMELPSLASLQASVPRLHLPQSLSSCFRSESTEALVNRNDEERCVFSTLPHLNLPPSVSSCFHSNLYIGNHTKLCLLSFLRHLHFPEYFTSCFASDSPTLVVPPEQREHCMFDNVWTSLQAAMPHLPESLSSCFQSQDQTATASKDVEKCLFRTLSEEVMRALGSTEQQVPHAPITRWPFLIFLFGATVCLFTSCTCHLLGCQSESLNGIFWRCDYAGIAILITTSFYPPVYYGFLCEPLVSTIYLSTITVIGVTSVLVSLLEVFQKPSFRPMRAIIFFGMGVSGAIPTMHKLLTSWDERVIVVTTIYTIVMGSLYGLGALFYASRVPERWSPGKFDIAGHSHQIFHVLVVAGALTHYATSLIFLRWRDQQGCDGRPS